MGTIQFTAIVGAERVIRPPAGVDLPQGQVEVEVRAAHAGPNTRPGPGLCKGMITYMAPDFDAPLDDLREYME